MSTFGWIALGVAMVAGALLFTYLTASSSFTGDYRLMGMLVLLGGVATVVFSVMRGKK